MQKIYLPPEVCYVIDKLTSAGYEAYAVGGCVRDHLMGKTPGDYDVTTSARPEEMLEVFSTDRVIETGLKHGTLTVLKNGLPIETTTYRIDGSYADGRHPDKVTFTPELSLDLCRRDFTVNAMAYSEKKGIIDLFGGEEDLKNGIIRCVGSPDERFHEDGLRILRAMRFASVLDFELESECASSVIRLRELLSKISRERIYTETTKLLLGRGAGCILSAFSEVVAFCISELDPDMVKRAADKIDLCPKNYEMRYALLFSELDKNAARNAINSLKPSNADKTTVLMYHEYKNDTSYLGGNYNIRRLISKTGDDFALSLPNMHASCGLIDESERDRAVAEIGGVIERDEARKLSDLAIDGKALISLGYTGQGIGRELAVLLDGVMLGEVENNADVLINKAKKDMENV